MRFIFSKRSGNGMAQHDESWRRLDPLSAAAARAVLCKLVWRGGAASLGALDPVRRIADQLPRKQPRSAAGPHSPRPPSSPKIERRHYSPVAPRRPRPLPVVGQPPRPACQPESASAPRPPRALPSAKNDSISSLSLGSSMARLRPDLADSLGVFSVSHPAAPRTDDAAPRAAPAQRIAGMARRPRSPTQLEDVLRVEAADRARPAAAAAPEITRLNALAVRAPAKAQPDKRRTGSDDASQPKPQFDLGGKQGSLATLLQYIEERPIPMFHPSSAGAAPLVVQESLTAITTARHAPSAPRRRAASNQTPAPPAQLQRRSANDARSDLALVGVARPSTPQPALRRDGVVPLNASCPDLSQPARSTRALGAPPRRGFHAF